MNILTKGDNNMNNLYITVTKTENSTYDIIDIVNNFGSYEMEIQDNHSCEFTVKLSSEYYEFDNLQKRVNELGYTFDIGDDD